MARQRFIHPEIWTDPSVGKLTPIERLFFIGCFSNADDEGRLLGNPAYLRSVIFPYDDLSLDEIRAIRDRVVSVCKNLVLYEVNGLECLAFLKWTRYQKPKYPKPSKLPPPPTDSETGTDTRRNIGETFLQNGGKHGEAFPQNGGNVVEEFPQDFSMGLGMGKGMGMGMGKDNGSSEKLLPGKESVVLEGGGVGEGTKPAADAAYSLYGDENSGSDDKPDEPSSDATALERSILRELKLVPGYPFDFRKDLRYVRDLAVAFPELDLLAEAQRWRTYKLDKPLTPKSNPRLQFRHWCEIAVKRRPEKIRDPTGGSVGGRAGPDRQNTTPDWERRFYGEDG